MRTAILIPVLDEEQALPLVLDALPGDARTVVCDNGSTDGSVALARARGVEVVHEPRRGYGGAVQAGLRHLAADPPEVVVILDGDHSAWAEDIAVVVAPIREGRADPVLGERITLGDPDALTLPQRAGNRLASRLVQLRTGHRYRDFGPLRALRWSALAPMGLVDPTWGWNVEMQLKALRCGVRVLEVPVRHRPRVGQSKISGTVQGVARAGSRILWACWTYR